MEMRPFAVAVMVAGMWCAGVRGAGTALTGEEKAFFDQHISDVIKIEPTRLAGPAIKKVFAASFYEVTIEIKEGDGSETQKVIVVKSGSALASATRPNTDSNLPDFPKMLNPGFKLKTDADAKVMQAALDAVYPITMDDDKKVAGFKHTGNQWTFARGKFFDKHLGFVFETDAAGTVTGAKYSLKLP